MVDSSITTSDSPGKPASTSLSSPSAVAGKAVALADQNAQVLADLVQAFNQLAAALQTSEGRERLLAQRIEEIRKLRHGQ